jgi:DNA-binding CsgD family transcriptional regulator
MRRPGGLTGGPPSDSGDLLRRTRDVLDLVAALTGSSVGPVSNTRIAPSGAESALDAAQAAIVGALADTSLSMERRGQLSAVLVQSYQVQTVARQSAMSRRIETLGAVQGVLARLRPSTSVAQLIDRGPAEVGKLGYERCLFSKLDRGNWIPRSAFVHNDPAAADAIRNAGSVSPRRVDHQLVESELVRRRSAIVVLDPQGNPRVHPELLAVTNSKAYVAAPFVVGRQVIGFMHVDGGEDGIVDESDRHVVGMLAEALGCAFERAMYREQLQAIRRKVVESSAMVADMVDEMVAGDFVTEGQEHVAAEDRFSSPARYRGSDVARQLTARELEVMELMAAGDTNRKIASTLFVTEATVKAHVKHILRKLTAANRAEAVSRYLQR